ncbi:MAG: tripartite tricarboxylate transporter substrate-binding protein [Pigmentiphaga sp.]|uniref:tripartite tricarboxylate transporter substrate-binding protein n=1 Tax=Pigmentiphaga sp. TaxID=1977564 RepID=UPI0029B7E076|nr:tripartite tricarboxylate transporter substrate-binding protein [Pigmentiphaga sp.]MDX3907044.1 tripartite tricarboxylate transporter substrate-binding protein [Pigmentiphaga sp.]
MKFLKNIACLGALCASLGMASAYAQSGGGPLVRFVVGFPAGGGVDAVARAVAQRVQQQTGRTVVVENRAGAGSRIAAEHVKSARADGNTVFIAPGSIMTLYPSTYKDLGYDPMTDFVPVTTLIDVQSALFANANVPVRNIQEFKAWVAADAAKRSSLGSPADGSGPHFLGMTIMHGLGLPVTPIVYKGTAPMVADVLGGHIPAAVNPIADLIEYHRAGKLRILAVGGNARSPLLPDVPTFQEAGLKVVGGEEWYGVFLPKGTPVDRQRELAQAIQVALKDPTLIQPFAERGWSVHFRQPGQVADLLKAEAATWRAVVKSLNYQPQ